MTLVVSRRSPAGSLASHHSPIDPTRLINHGTIANQISSPDSTLSPSHLPSYSPMFVRAASSTSLPTSSINLQTSLTTQPHKLCITLPQSRYAHSFHTVHTTSHHSHSNHHHEQHTQSRNNNMTKASSLPTNPSSQHSDPSQAELNDLSDFAYQQHQQKHSQAVRDTSIKAELFQKQQQHGAATQTLSQESQMEQQQYELTEELLSLTEALKNNAQNISKALKEDEKVLDRADSSLTTNLSAIQTENARLKKWSENACSETCMYMFLLSICITVFFLTFIFIKLFPAPKYNPTVYETNPSIQNIHNMNDDTHHHVPTHPQAPPHVQYTYQPEDIPHLDQHHHQHDHHDGHSHQDHDHSHDEHGHEHDGNHHHHHHHHHGHHDHRHSHPRNVRKPHPSSRSSHKHDDL